MQKDSVSHSEKHHHEVRGDATRETNAPSQANILLMLQNSISSLNQKFEVFQTGFDTKINSIEENYNTLSYKIDQLATKDEESAERR